MELSKYNEAEGIRERIKDSVSRNATLCEVEDEINKIHLDDRRIGIKVHGVELENKGDVRFVHSDSILLDKDLLLEIITVSKVRELENKEQLEKQFNEL